MRVYTYLLAFYYILFSNKFGSYGPPVLLEAKTVVAAARPRLEIDDAELGSGPCRL